MSPRARAALWGLIALGTAIRLGIAFKAGTGFFDLDSVEVTRRGLAEHGLHVYSAVDGDVFRWPYPPAYFPVIAALRGIASVTGADFLQLVRLPPIAADAGLAWLVQHLLGRGGAGERLRLAGAAAIALGPIFVGTAGYHGQMDSVAILPAVAALAVWEQGGPRRALAAGLLVGLGASLKTVPILMLLALAPSARSRREGAVLLAAAVAVPLALLAPFLVADPDGVTHALTYHGNAGAGGLSLVVQPDLGLFWLATHPFDASGATLALKDASGPVLVAALAALAVLLARTRPPPRLAAALVWLTVYVAGVNFLLQYLVWGLPFFLLLGAVGRVWALELALAPALLLTYLKPNADGVVWSLYTVELIAAWVAFAVALVVLARRATASRAFGSTRAAPRAGPPSRPR